MQNPHGRIVSVYADDFGTNAVVEIDAVIACERCASGKGCGAGLLGGRSGERQVKATVTADLNVRDGDIVSIVLEPRNLLRAAFIVYGYPLAGAVLAAIAVFSAGFGDGVAAASALSGIIAGYFVAKVRLRNTQCLRDFTPMVVAKLTSVTE